MVKGVKTQKTKKSPFEEREELYDIVRHKVDDICNAAHQGKIYLNRPYIIYFLIDRLNDDLEQLTWQYRKEGLNDLYGNGDQSSVKADFPHEPGYRFRDFWASSGNFYETVMEGGAGSDFMRNCFRGHADKVKEAIDNTGPGSTARMHLLEYRESNLRYSPLMTCICGAKNREYLRLTDGDHFRVAEYLCEAGACVDSKDVAGYTPVHQATSCTANAHSLAIFRLLCHKYGANPNVPNRFGDIALTEPLMRGLEDNVEALLACGAKVSV